MIIYHQGMFYMHRGNWLYADETSRCTYAEWIAAGRDSAAIIWQHYARR